MAIKKFTIFVVMTTLTGMCNASICKVEQCPDSPTKFTAMFGPCPVKLGGKINITANGIAPRDVKQIFYDAVFYFADDPESPIFEVSGSADCSTAKEKQLPFRCPVKKGDQLGVKNLIVPVPNKAPFDSDNYKVKAKFYTGDKKLLGCANILFELDASENDRINEKPFN